MKALRFLAAFLLMAVGPSLWGLPYGPSDVAARYGAKPDPLSARDLARAAFFFSGVPESTIEGYMTRVDEGIARFSAADPGGDALTRGEALLQFLHQNYFNRYVEPQTRLDVVLDTGNYNCVSSAVLYIVFAVELNIPVTGVSTHDHAFCRVGTPGNQVDVETTTEYGFDPGSKKEFTDSFGRTGFSYVPPGNYGDRQDRSLREMVAFILQNRMSELEHRNRFDLALPLAVDDYTFSQTQETRVNLYRAAANYASQLNENLDYRGAMQFLEQFQSAYGQDPSLDGIESITVYNAVVELSNAADYAGARLLLDDPRLDEKSRTELRGLVAGNAAIEATSALNLDATIVYLEGEKSLLDQNTYREILVAKAGQEANGYASRGDFLGAAAILKKVDDLLGGDSRLREGVNVFLNNYAITIHNQFVPLFNAGDLEAARQLVEDGLKVVPGNRVLIADQRMLDQN